MSTLAGRSAAISLSPDADGQLSSSGHLRLSGRRLSGSCLENGDSRHSYADGEESRAGRVFRDTEAQHQPDTYSQPTLRTCVPNGLSMM